MLLRVEPGRGGELLSLFGIGVAAEEVSEFENVDDGIHPLKE